ncbi:hypothetical protein IE81DRAFT_72883 [Ceraceosorus guamensis]|uniref:F-box domain-containing protein n=1 Tax=Ceraceosorus guamensis TaxID=1522189 RepID=A0A316W3F7_9BASI|nr:hypothetical protein IE81DRAFT_72883 [Ceraceosorus guamensis]PWN43638.1 hypothetical protein IE81DRAFT_72883 [Ceraceosorus guamensis]
MPWAGPRTLVHNGRPDDLNLRWAAQSLCLWSKILQKGYSPTYNLSIKEAVRFAANAVRARPDDAECLKQLMRALLGAQDPLVSRHHLAQVEDAALASEDSTVSALLLALRGQLDGGPITNLPSEILLQILQQLPTTFLCEVACCNRFWHQVASTTCLWQHVSISAGNQRRALSVAGWTGWSEPRPQSCTAKVQPVTLDFEDSRLQKCPLGRHSLDAMRARSGDASLQRLFYTEPTSLHAAGLRAYASRWHGHIATLRPDLSATRYGLDSLVATDDETTDVFGGTNNWLALVVSHDISKRLLNVCVRAESARHVEHLWQVLQPLASSAGALSVLFMKPLFSTQWISSEGPALGDLAFKNLHTLVLKVADNSDSSTSVPTLSDEAIGAMPLLELPALQTLVLDWSFLRCISWPSFAMLKEIHILACVDKPGQVPIMVEALKSAKTAAAIRLALNRVEVLESLFSNASILPSLVDLDVDFRGTEEVDGQHPGTLWHDGEDEVQIGRAEHAVVRLCAVRLAASRSAPAHVIDFLTGAEHPFPVPHTFDVLSAASREGDQSLVEQPVELDRLSKETETIDEEIAALAWHYIKSRPCHLDQVDHCLLSAVDEPVPTRAVHCLTITSPLSHCPLHLALWLDKHLRVRRVLDIVDFMPWC